MEIKVEHTVYHVNFTSTVNVAFIIEFYLTLSDLKIFTHAETCNIQDPQK